VRARHPAAGLPGLRAPLHGFGIDTAGHGDAGGSLPELVVGDGRLRPGGAEAGPQGLTAGRSDGPGTGAGLSDMSVLARSGRQVLPSGHHTGIRDDQAAGAARWSPPAHSSR